MRRSPNSPAEIRGGFFCPFAEAAVRKPVRRLPVALML